MENETRSTQPSWIVCSDCDGEGKILRPPTRKARLRYKRARQENNVDVPPPPVGRWEPCKTCASQGLVERMAANHTDGMPNFTIDSPRIAVIGGGLAGLAFATAARHRGLQCTVYERDEHFHQRRQGYGLTMQQASKALCRFGITELRGGITSTKHVVHQQDGQIVGEWGLRKWGRPEDKKEPKRQNVHIARQALRYQLWQTAGNENICWNHRLQQFEENENSIKLSFQVGDKVVNTEADIVIGADGIRSQVRNQLIGEEKTPLRYLGCIVMLGICPLEGLPESPLLDGETVFQTADGTTRIYMMPYSTTEYMWQLSYPMAEEEASKLSQLGAAALKEEAIQRCKSWHSPVSEILRATPVELVSGYPVYDRALLTAFDLQVSNRVTLIGDACHPMSPFKGQGANQALLDALSLAGSIYKVCKGKGEGDHPFAKALAGFEAEMLERSAVKVEASAEAAKFLHTPVAIQQGNVTRGAASKEVEI